MSNGIGPNPLNAISKVYLEQVAKKKKDDTYLETDFKKRQANNEKARKELAKGPQMKNPHFEEREHGWDVVNTLSNVYKEMQEGIRDTDPEKGTAERKARLEKKRGMKLDDHPQYKKEEKDPFGRPGGKYGGVPKKGSGYDKAYQANMKKIKELEQKEELEVEEGLDPVNHKELSGKHSERKDKDIDNDGDVDTSDKYLHKRRKAIGKAIKKKMSEQEEKIGGGNLKKLAGKATKRIDADNDGDVDKDDPKEKGMGEFVPTPDGKKKLRTSVKNESYSWRKDLAEIMTDDIDSKPIKEKKVNNKIKINPKLGESLEQLGGELIEMVEVDEFDCIVEEVYQGLLSEGYNEQLATDAIEYGIEEAKVTYGHDTEDRTERTRDKLKKKAKGFLGKIAYKAYNKARDLKRAAEPAVQRAKTSAKRGIRKAALKVADKLKEDSSMSSQEVALQKRKSVIDQMIARKRMQDLQKNKEKETPSKAMGEESAYEKVKASMGKAFIDTKKLPKRQHWSKEHMRDPGKDTYSKKND